jgi:hypothetical protein
MKRPFVENLSKDMSSVQTKKANVENEKVPCTLCGKLCKNTRGVSMHISSSHTCNHCKGTFKDLEQHIQSVHETEQCTECTEKFSSTTGLQRHLSQYHLVRCDICNKKFYSPNALRKHMQEEHEEECNMCQKNFLKTENLLEAHMENIHGIKPRVVKQFAGGMFMIVCQ